MHVAEGILSVPVLISGGAVAAGGFAVGLKKTHDDDVPKTALLSAAFFIASFVHIPVGLYSVHLVLNGLVGLLLGWSAFPCILAALILQAILFQFGGLTTLGVNAVIMAGPAVACHYLFRRGVKSRSPALRSAAAFLAGFTGILLGAAVLAGSLYFSGSPFKKTAEIAFAANIPLAAVEGVVTAMCVNFLRKVKPEILGPENGEEPA